MTTAVTLKRSIALSVLLLIAVAGTTIAGIQGTGKRMLAVFGPVEAGPGLHVNGVGYDTSHARVSVNGHASMVAQLKPGHIVAIQGTSLIDGLLGIADAIVLESDLRGEVTSVDAAAGAFTVLSQTIQVTSDSVLDPRIQPAGLDGLARGTWVKVSAFELSDGTFVASRVDLDSAPGELQVRGVVDSLDSVNRTYRVGGLTIDYSAAVVDGSIAEGRTILARGVQPQENGPLIATSVEVFTSVGAPGEKGDIEGYVTSFTSATEFSVNGQRVSSDSDTNYVLHGQTLGPDLEVRVTGRFNDSSVLVAKKIQADAPKKAKRGPRAGK